MSIFLKEKWIKKRNFQFKRAHFYYLGCMKARIYSLVTGHKISDVKLLADGDTGGFVCLCQSFGQKTFFIM